MSRGLGDVYKRQLVRQACPGMPSLAGLEYGKRISRERGPSWDPKVPSEFARAAQILEPPTADGENFPPYFQATRDALPLLPVRHFSEISYRGLKVMSPHRSKWLHHN